MNRPEDVCTAGHIRWTAEMPSHEPAPLDNVSFQAESTLRSDLLFEFVCAHPEAWHVE